jgi:two-component system nitrate/nitrite response regulator NarL
MSWAAFGLGEAKRILMDVECCVDRGRSSRVRDGSTRRCSRPSRGRYVCFVSIGLGLLPSTSRKQILMCGFFHLLFTKARVQSTPPGQLGRFVARSQELLPQSIRVAVADATRMNSQLIVGALKRSHSNFEVRALSSNSSVAVHELQDYRPDVAVISAQLEDGPLTGFKILHQLRASDSKTPAVMLLDSTDRELVVDAFRAGARGVFCRDYSFKALPKCIRRVHEGQVWVSNVELEFLLELVVSMRPMKARNSGGMALLTPREKDVVRLAAEGMRNQEIAAKLKVSEHTVRNYMFRIFDKLGISSRVELVLYAFSGVEGIPALISSGSDSSWQ